MKYNSIVLIKQVPDTKNITGEAMREDGTVNRAALPAIFNPDDLNALESALSLRDKFGGTVKVLTMGPPFSAEILRESLYRGADEVIQLSDRKFAGADTLATAYTLSKAIEKIGNFDFIFCGRQAIDGDTAQVGPQVAAKLNIPQITFVDKIEKIDGDTISAKRNIEGGYEIIQTKLPVLLTIMGTANEPRYPACKLMMRYKKARSAAEIEVENKNKPANPNIKEKSDELAYRNLLIQTWKADDIDLNLSKCGSSGSPTFVAKISSVQLESKEFKKIEPEQNSINELITELISEHILG